MHTHTHTHTQTHTHTYIYMNTVTHTHTHIIVHTTHTHARTQTHTHTQTHAQNCTHTHTHTQWHIHTHCGTFYKYKSIFSLFQNVTRQGQRIRSCGEPPRTCISHSCAQHQQASNSDIRHNCQMLTIRNIPVQLLKLVFKWLCQWLYPVMTDAHCPWEADVKVLHRFKVQRSQA